MPRSGRVIIRGIVQGVGFRPFVYAKAKELGIRGHVKNLGSEVEVVGAGERFDEFVSALRSGPPLSRIDQVIVSDYHGVTGKDFQILPSEEGVLSGMIPPDIATCDECIADIDSPESRYHQYWCTSCVNCGPRYSIIQVLPYDRERTSMTGFPMCLDCSREYGDQFSRRHHAQTIACQDCGPRLRLLSPDGEELPSRDPIHQTAILLDEGEIIAIRGVGGFHIACTEESAPKLKDRLGRSEQPFAVMIRPDYVDRIARVSVEERALLMGQERPIVVLEKKDPAAHAAISNLHTIGCMFPYSGLHHILFRHLRHPLLIMTSANMPGYPMITGIDHAMALMRHDVDYFLTHDRVIVNRCDDSVVRDGFIIRLSRGIAPKRTAIDLGRRCILGVGPELNSNVSLYRDGFVITSPHIGNVRNPQTYAYLQETIAKITTLLGAGYEVIAHDAHPQFLSTRYARELADVAGAELVPVQHHRAHIAATTRDACVGIAIDGVGYGDDGTIWGGEIFAGMAPGYDRTGHLEVVPMPGGDLATRYPERMLYGILPEPEILEVLISRGWTDIEAGVLETQVKREINLARTSSTGRVLDAAAALLGICRERTYDGEPAMKLESFAIGGRARPWEPDFFTDGSGEVFSTRSLFRNALTEYLGSDRETMQDLRDIAASFQFNLARGIAGLAIHTAEDRGLRKVALSGGVAYNRAIRETIRDEIVSAGLEFVMNPGYPLGDGCISFGQCVYAGMSQKG